MESIVLAPLLQVVFEKVASPILGELASWRDFTENIEKLRDRLPMIQAVIEDAETRQLRNEGVKDWLRKLRDVAYDADDILDELTTQVLQRQLNAKVRINCSPLKPYPFYFKMSRPKPYASYFKMSRKLKPIIKRLDDIVGEMSNFQFREAIVYRRSDTGERRQTGPQMDEPKVYGRGEEVEKIVEMLLSTNFADISIMAIVGLGGIGKTTLAQLAYNDERVTGHFDLKMWVSVYDNFKVRELINDILDQTTRGKCESSQLGVLQSQLRESLCGKRYLLVLDDVWNEDPDEWGKLRNPLRGGAAGSKIIVTTRSKKVASVMSTTAPYILEALTDDDWWTLFKQRAFRDGEEGDFSLSPLIAQQLKEKCGGLPLAAKILGGLVYLRREEFEGSPGRWGKTWNLEQGEATILSVLRLSYDHLPSHLKQCFRYCSVFPKNFAITKEKLINLWIAEGLIPSSCDTNPSSRYTNSCKMEDSGNEYFNDLSSMSFFERAGKHGDSSITEFKMHELIHDLAREITGDEVSILRPDLAQSHHSFSSYGNLARTRHASVVCNFRSAVIPEALFGAKKLRTLIFLSPRDDSGESLRAAVRVSGHLRVLDLSGSGIKRLHKSIGGLIYLRYLDISNTLIETLPETICNLCNLQTLNLLGCNDLMNLPSGITNLINLRHLNIKECARLTRMPDSIRNLRNLRTLPFFIVGPREEESLFQLQFLKLQGELTIKHLENVVAEKGPMYFLRYKNLSSLRLSWGNDNEGKPDHYSSRQTAEGYQNLDVEYVTRGLQPNHVLRRLSIHEYPGIRFPEWMNNNGLPNLAELVLINCRQQEYLPTLGQLPFLRVLNMQGMDAVVNIGSQLYDGPVPPFPSLTELTLRDFPALRNWYGADSREAFHCLNRLNIIKSPRLESMPRFPSLQHLELRNCNERILFSAAKLHSLTALVIDVFAEPFFLPEALLGNNSLIRYLRVSAFPKLRFLPASLGDLAALKSLTISCCDELETLPRQLKNLTSLETLEISECPSLVSLREESIEGLSSLRSFSIENCNSLTALPMGMKHLRALESLTIMFCSDLAYQPDCLQHLSALRSLNIVGCPQLASLPEGLQQIQTLQNLQIRKCPELMELPKWVDNLVSLRSLAISECQNIESLPEGLQRLTGLHHLSIRDCPQLEGRCEKGRGEDWPKISHIQYIYIGSSALQQGHDIASSSSN